MHNKIKDVFTKNFSWNFWGSVLYECVKTCHNIFLMHCMPAELYGQLGSLLSSIYLMTRLADFGSAYSLAPFIGIILSSKKSFRFILGKVFGLTQIPIIGVISGAALLIFKNMTTTIHVVLIALAIVILETLRLFLRYLLHITFKSKYVMIVELSSFAFYVSAIWIYFFTQGYLSLQVIVLLHVVDSFLVVNALLYKSFRLYRSLPSDQSPEKKSTYHLIIQRLFNYLNRLSREIFANNFLTPLFSVYFGYEKIGSFYLAGVIATSLQGIIRTTFSYSGSALLAHLKKEHKDVKQSAFKSLSAKLIALIMPFVLIIGFNTNVISHYLARSCPQFPLMLLLFVLLASIDLLLSLYEQFYIIEESTHTFFAIKALECALLVIIFYSFYQHSIVTLLAYVILLRCLILSITMLDAYMRWQVSPTSYHTIRSLGGWCCASFIIHTILTYAVKSHL